MSPEMWTFLGVVITNVVILVGLFYRQGKQGKSVDQINRAVNHQAVDAPTLIQRVMCVEDRVREIGEETVVHRAWEHRVFNAIANHVGFMLPIREVVADHPLIDPTPDTADDAVDIR